jgi:hypothetical protein
MLSEPKEPSKRESDRPEKEKGSSKSRNKEFKPIWNSPDKNNSMKKQLP